MKSSHYPSVTLAVAFVFASMWAVACDSDESDPGPQDLPYVPDVRPVRDVSEVSDLESDADEGEDSLGETDIDDVDVEEDLISEDVVDVTVDEGEDEPDVEIDTCEGSCAPSLVCEAPDPEWLDYDICGDGQDNDGNGEVDEGCACAMGTTQRCFNGSPAERNVGGCLDGIQICMGSPPTWGPCEGGIPPMTERCDLKDNDCDGCVDDELVDCIPALTCPVEDTARPLTWYTLDGPSMLTLDSVSWEWLVIPPSNSATTSAEDPDAPVTQVFLDVSGDYLINLTAVDEKGTQHGCTWIVHAMADGLRVELTWDTYGSVDVDLHLHRPGTTTDWCHPVDDCFYSNCNVSTAWSPSDLPDWGYPNSPSENCIGLAACPNPRLDIDNIHRYDPENINIDNPGHGDTFRIMVHMYSGGLPTNPKVSVYCGGRLRSVIGEAPDSLLLTQSASGCMGHTWRVADVRTFVDAESGTTDCIVDIQSNASGDYDLRLNDNSY